MEIIECLIDDIALKIKTGKTPSTSNPEYFDGTVKWLTPSDLKGQKNINISERNISDKALNDNEAFLFEPKTIIISTIGDIGKTCIIDEPAATNQQLTGIKVDENIILSELFYYWIQRSKGLLLNKANKAIISILNNKLLRRIKISFPKKLSDQSVIISQLNKIQELIDKRVKTIQYLENYINSVFLEMFLENTQSNTWKIKTIRKAKGISKITYGTAKKANSESVGLPVIRMNNISYSGELQLDAIKWVELTDDESQKLRLENRHVLFNRTNSPDLVGKITVWDKGEGYTFAGYLIRLEMNEAIMNPYYFSSYFNSQYGKKILMNKARPSGTLANISATNLLNQKILLSPIELQREYEEIFLNVQLQKQRYKKSLQFLETLFQSSLQNAFSVDSLPVNEIDFFENLLSNLGLDELKQGVRIENLIYWLNKEKNLFSNLKNYDIAIQKLLLLLEENLIEQVLENGNIVLKARK